MTPLTAIPPPVVGETLPSWLDRVSAANHMSLGWTLHQLGLAPNTVSNAMPTGYGHHLPEQQLTALANAAGVEPAVVRGMLTTSWIGTRAKPVPGADEASNDARKFGFANWMYLSGSHYCPRCLAENGGAWLMQWKSPFTFACANHGEALRSTCPMCGGRAAVGRREHGLKPAFPAYVPEPGHCRNPRRQTEPRRTKGPCGHDHTVDEPGISMSSEWTGLQAALNVNDKPFAWWNDLRALAAYVITTAPIETVVAILGEPLNQDLATVWNAQWQARIDRLANARTSDQDHRSVTQDTTGRTPPTDPLLMAVASAVAHACLNDDAALIELVRGGRDTDPTGQLPHSRIEGLGASAKLNDRVLSAYRGDADHLARIGMHSRYRTVVTDLDPANIPPYIWDDLFDQHIAPLTQNVPVNRATLRRFTSIAVRRSATAETWTQATTHFADRHLRNPRLASAVLTSITQSVGTDGVNAVLIAISSLTAALTRDQRSQTYASERADANRVYAHSVSRAKFLAMYPGLNVSASRKRWAAVSAWVDATSDHPVNAPAWGPTGPSANDLEAYRVWTRTSRT